MGHRIPRSVTMVMHKMRCLQPVVLHALSVRRRFQADIAFFLTWSASRPTPDPISLTNLHCVTLVTPIFAGKLVAGRRSIAHRPVCFVKTILSMFAIPKKNSKTLTSRNYQLYDLTWHALYDYSISPNLLYIYFKLYLQPVCSKRTRVISLLQNRLHSTHRIYAAS